ncbi:UNVERIFIED_CONTAM: hypothetical protein Scaly_2870400 [Sesamum calycinum]|uniref:Uncharacterized protein n=1 Tax=Sesamum calycinum TaxID=2727403 RepID=A0AAW2L8X6_9LAMI
MDRGKSKKTGEKGSGTDWERDEGKEWLERQQQWNPVFDEVSMSNRPLKKVKSPERNQDNPFNSSLLPQQPASQPPMPFPSPYSGPVFPFSLENPSISAPLLRPPLHQNQQQMISFAPPYPNQHMNFAFPAVFFAGRQRHRHRPRAGPSETLCVGARAGSVFNFQDWGSFPSGSPKDLVQIGCIHFASAWFRPMIFKFMRQGDNWKGCATRAPSVPLGPGSPVWDDLDANNNLLLPPNLPFNQHDSQHDSPSQKQNDNFSSSSSSYARPFFWKDQD